MPPGNKRNVFKYELAAAELVGSNSELTVFAEIFKVVARTFTRTSEQTQSNSGNRGAAPPDSGEEFFFPARHSTRPCSVPSRVNDQARARAGDDER